MDAVAQTGFPDLNRLKTATERYAAGNGLNFIFVGMSFLLSSVIRFFLIPFWLLILFLLASIAIARYIRRYSERRFGWVEPKPPSNRAVGIFLLIMFVGVFSRHWIDNQLNPILSELGDRIHFAIWDPHHLVDIQPLVFWMVLCCTSIRSSVIRKGRSVLLLFAFGLLAWSGVAFSPLWHPKITQLTLWRVLNEGWLGLTMIAIGLYQYVDLLRLMPRSVVENTDE
jgi:Ca2+/Na+ antiporter